jgi:RNA polymerase sigma-70 factor, ECF subfamily
MIGPTRLPTAPTSDEEFSMSALRSGDKLEFSRVVEAYSGRLYRLIFRMVNQPQDAEDILQETFIKVFKNVDRFDGRSKLSTWLYRIATNEALMQLRRKNPEMVSIEEPDSTAEASEQEPLQIVDWCCIPEAELLSDEARLHLDRAVSQLPASLRAVFLLRDIEGLSTLEAADVLGISETALKTRLSRARLWLRNVLSIYYGEKLGGVKNATR